MPKKKGIIKKYRINRGLEKGDEWRFEAGDVVTKDDIPGAPISKLLESGVLSEEDK